MTNAFRQMKPHYVTGVRYPLAEDAQLVPPAPCDLEVGDLVTYTNDRGVKWHDQIITGFSPTISGGRFVYFDHAAWWFAVEPGSLSKQAHRHTEGPYGSEIGVVPTTPALASF